MPMMNRPADAVSAVRAIGERVRPVALARERVLPVHPLLAALFPDGGLHRGAVVGCDGAAPLSLGLALASAASQAGAWTGIVGMPSLGAAAAAELGVAMERVFLVASPPAEHRLTVLAATIDGADVVITSGVGVRAGEARRLAARLSARGGVLLVVGPVGEFIPDIVCRVVTAQWEGLEAGAGRLSARRALVESTGRRAGRRRQVELWFPGPDGSLAPLAAAVTGLDEPRPVARAG